MSIRKIPVIVIALATIFGCSTKPEEHTALVSMPTNIAAELSANALSRLEEADKLDGSTDHVIGKCYVCGLGMDGSQNYAVTVQGYTAHLCSKACQHEFEESAEEVVMGTEIPVGNKQN